MSTRPLGAQISHMLKARGVDVIFGIPGVHNVEMYRGIEEAGIRHILARHEQGAGFMADGYARASGKPGVAYVITGPGLTNIMTPMGQAYSDSVPLLVISSCLDETAARRGQLHQMIDQEGAAACVCDWSHEVKSAEAAYALVNRAFQEFHTARPRPKHIQVPIALLGTPCAAHDPEQTGASDGAEQIPDTLFGVLPHLLKDAKRPLLVLGGGAREASDDIRTLLSRCPMAVFTTYAGRGIVSPDYPYLYGSTLARPDSAEVVASSDLVIAVGTELSEVDLWRDRLGATGRMIRVDVDPQMLADGAGNTMRFRSTAYAFFKAFAEVPDLPDRFEWQAEAVAETRARWRAETDAERPGIVPVVDALRDAMPSDAMVFSDMTQFAYVAKEVWDMDWPGHWHHPYGYGTLGYGVPAAIGGAIARDGQPTLAICGDSGFQYTLQEIGTAVEHGLPLPIILWDNGKLKEIEDSMIRSQIAPNAVIARNPDFCALAKAYGAHAVQPASLDEMAQAVRTAFGADRPTLVHVKAGIA